MTVRFSAMMEKRADAVDERSETMPVQERLRFDVAGLERFLREHDPDFHGPVTVEQFAGGQSNPTYLITNADGQRYVLRRKPPGNLLPSAHAVDREHRVITALAETGVPVPRTYALCEDESVIGTPFFLMEHVEGRIFWDQTLPGLASSERAAIYNEMNRAAAALHGVDYAAAGLADYGKPGNYLARQIARWTKQYRASETESIEAMDRLIDWLPENIPPGDETAVVHGDYRMDNMIFHPTEPRLLAILDWELSTLGHPLADFSYHVMSWRISPEEFRGLGGVDLDALGIPQESDYVAAYCRRTGRDRIEYWDFYMAYNMFRLAGILQGIMGRVVDGTAASRNAVEMGKKARIMAEAGWREAEKMIARS
jgi:aminoglycoside phosphotransferase (APT) family kinase protein